MIIFNIYVGKNKDKRIIKNKIKTREIIQNTEVLLLLLDYYCCLFLSNAIYSIIYTLIF